jgi:hypothetical protein
VVFAVALLVHGADHLRRGTDVLSGEVMWAGTVQNAGALVTLVLVFTRHRLAPLAAILIGFTSAFGFTVVHFLPEHGFFSDAFPGADAHADVTPFSWAAAAFEVVVDLAIGPRACTCCGAAARPPLRRQRPRRRSPATRS